MYIIKYATGDIPDYRTHNIFVTKDKSTAQSYVNKFNKLLESYQAFYTELEETDQWGQSTLKEEYDQYWERWRDLQFTHNAFIEEIEER